MTTYEFYMKVANMLAKSRNDANKSQVQMADLLGVNKKTILNWENGHNRPDPVMLIKWFQVLHLDIIEYFLIEFKGPTKTLPTNPVNTSFIKNPCEFFLHTQSKRGLGKWPLF